MAQATLDENEMNDADCGRNRPKKIRKSELKQFPAGEISCRPASAEENFSPPPRSVKRA